VTKTHRIILSGAAPEGATVQAGRIEDYVERSHGAELDAARLEGQADGRASALTGAAASLDAAASALEASREECISEVTKVAVELGLGIARRLVRAELAAERHDIEAIVRDVLASTSDGRTTTKIYVSPEDAASLEEVTFRAATEVISDEAVSTGSVRVETPQGVLVRDIDECMRSVADRLTKEVTK
jgi:flagellar biosynthesis/type III secretory pathway protein FliH